jgi:hypothetical protein
VVSALLATAAFVASPAPTCPATTVNYQLAKNPGYGDAPWVLARPSASGVLASLPAYPQSLRDARVNRSNGLVLWTRDSRIVWNVSGNVVARRLDGPGRFVVQSELRFPTAGCWRLTHRVGLTAVSVVARVLAPPKALGCAATVLDSGWAVVRPHSSGIRGGWPWRVTGPATLTTHGHDGDRNMKVPWWIRRNWGSTLALTGTRLDSRGSFEQEFIAATDHDGPDDQMVYPSIVDIPAPGCWLLTLRSATLAGVIVVRAVNGS